MSAEPVNVPAAAVTVHDPPGVQVMLLIVVAGRPPVPPDASAAFIQMSAKRSASMILFLDIPNRPADLHTGAAIKVQSISCGCREERLAVGAIEFKQAASIKWHWSG